MKQVVEALRAGTSPTEAAQAVVQRMAHWFPKYKGAVVAVSSQGEHGAAAHGWPFQYAIRRPQQHDVQVIDIQPLDAMQQSYASY